MSLCTCLSAILQYPLVVRLNYKLVTKSCEITDHFIQNTFDLRTIHIHISDESFLCLTFLKWNLGLCTVQFISALDSTIWLWKYLMIFLPGGMAAIFSWLDCLYEHHLYPYCVCPSVKPPK